MEQKALMKKPIGPPGDRDNVERNIERAFEIERDLADVLRKCAPNERSRKYVEVYQEWYQRCGSELYPDGARSPEDQGVKRTLAYIRRQLPTACESLIEIGAGDCVIAEALAQTIAEVGVLEVAGPGLEPEGEHVAVRVEAYDGIVVPEALAPVDAILSFQVMEHLHPTDAKTQLISIAQALRKEGVFIMQTPNRVTGPHDISKHFSDVPLGFHLKEYTVGELHSMLKEAGFAYVKCYAFWKGQEYRLPCGIVATLEWIISCFPHPIRRRIVKFRGLRSIFGINMVGVR